MTDPVRFAFAFDRLFELAGRPLGIRADSCHVSVDDDSFEVRFGRWHLATPRSNVAGAVATGPYSVPKVLGPPHLSFADRGVTFGTNARQGACIRFHHPVAALVPGRWLRHPAATVTVEDPAGLVGLLAAHTAD